MRLPILNTLPKGKTMNANEEHSRSKIPSLVTTVGSGPIPKGHVPLEEESITTFAEWFDQELKELEYRFRDFSTPQSIKGSLGR